MKQSPMIMETYRAIAKGTAPNKSRVESRFAPCPSRIAKQIRSASCALRSVSSVTTGDARWVLIMIGAEPLISSRHSFIQIS